MKKITILICTLIATQSLAISNQKYKSMIRFFIKMHSNKGTAIHAILTQQLTTLTSLYRFQKETILRKQSSNPLILTLLTIEKSASIAKKATALLINRHKERALRSLGDKFAPKNSFAALLCYSACLLHNQKNIIYRKLLLSHFNNIHNEKAKKLSLKLLKLHKIHQFLPIDP